MNRPLRTRPLQISLAVTVLLAALMMPVPLAAQTLDDAVDHHLAGNLDEALAAYHVVAARDLESDPVGAGIALNNACMILMDRGEYQPAQRDCEAAGPLLEGPELEDLQAENLNNLGIVYQNLGRFDEAERSLRRALELNRAIEISENVTINLANLGALAMVRGRYGEALELHRSAGRLAAANPGESWSARQILIARINEGVVWEKLGEHRQALELFREVLAAPDQALPYQAAAVRVNVGVIYRNLGDPVRAAAEIRTAIAEYRALGDRAGLSNAYLNLGIVQFLNLGDLAAADESLRAALSLARESGAVTEQIQDLFYLGSALLAAGEVTAAADAFAQCHDLAVSTGSPEGRWSSLAALARIRSRRGDHDGALQLLRRAMDEVEDVRSGLDAELRAGFFGERRAIYAATIDTLWQLHQVDAAAQYDHQAYAVAQRAKARTLLDALGAEAPEVAPVSADSVQRHLGTDLLLEYFVGAERSYLWAVESDALAMVDLGPTGTLRQQALAVVQPLAAGRTPDAGPLGRLGQRLVGPAAAVLDAGRRLRVAPDGLLAHVPFALLTIGGPDTALVRTMTLSTAPSGSMLTRARRQEPADNDAVRFVGVATDSGPSAVPDVDGRRELLARRFDLRPLPGSLSEIDDAIAALGGRSRRISGSGATEAAFRDSTADGTRVLHIATHAILDPRPAAGSAIVLAPDEQDDGLLHAREVAALPLDVDLAVLAACRTAIGVESDTSGIGSLTGAFLAAGARSVVATLWDVDDAATAAFMQQFYYFLGRGSEADVALRRAQLRLIDHAEWNRPQVWAAFVIVGQGDTRVAEPGPPWKPLLAAALVVLVSGAWLVWHRRQA